MTVWEFLFYFYLFFYEFNQESRRQKQHKAVEKHQPIFGSC